MLRKFSFWIVLVLLASIGSTIFIHWNALQSVQHKTALVHPLYQRQKIIDSLTLSLERYRRMSASFRKLSSDELTNIKSNLKTTFSEGVAQLDQLSPTVDEKVNEHQLNEQLNELLKLSAHFEPMLFTKDAYLKPEILSLHESILSTLSELEKSSMNRLKSLRTDSSKHESDSSVLLLGVGAFIFILILSILIRGHFVYVRPLRNLYLYANEFKQGTPVPSNPPHFKGMYGDIQNVINQLALGVESHVRDRHKFILDIASDLKSPLTMLQASKNLLGISSNDCRDQDNQSSIELVRRGMAIISGSLDDLNDIVDINRLESRLEEKTVDLSELLSDAARTITGINSEKKISVTVPPMPIWVRIDVKRFERVMIHLFSKVLDTMNDGENITVSISNNSQSGFRGVEILIQESDRQRNGRAPVGGPEQDILKHWISEKGLIVALAQKIIKAHGGSITASGIAGMSVSIAVRIPQERVVSQGLISPPTVEASPLVRGLVIQRSSIQNQGSII